MTKRLLVVVCLAALAGFSGMAQAATKKHPDSDAIAMRVLQSSSTGAVFTGTAKDKILGSGLVIVKATQVGNTATDTFVATAFFKNGTLSVKGTVTTTARSDGSGFDYAGSGKVTGGTGKVKGAKGSLKIVGSATAADPTYQTYKLTGSLTY